MRQWGSDPKMWFGSDLLPSRLPAIAADPAPDPRCMNGAFRGIPLFKTRLELRGKWLRSDGIDIRGGCPKARLISSGYLGVYRYLPAVREFSVLTSTGLETRTQPGPGEHHGYDDVVR